MGTVPSTPSTALDGDALGRAAVPFSLGEPEAFDTSVDALMASLGAEVTVLGFGEALHGGEEILRLRNRLFERLVERHGFTAMAIESSWPRGRRVDDFVTGCGPALYEAIKDAGFSHGLGRIEANRDLVEWMRRRSAAAGSAGRLHFHGFDMPGGAAGPIGPREVLAVALGRLAEMDAAAAQAVRVRIEPVIGDDARWENPMAWRDPAQALDLLASLEALRGPVEDLIAALATRRPEAAGFDDALHHAVLGRLLLNFFSALARGSDWAASLAVRDAIMAENLRHILHGLRGRLLVHAHNQHLFRGQAVWQVGPALLTWWSAGAHLHATIGERYAVIGTALGASEENGIAPPEPGTLEARLTALAGPGRWLALRHAALGAEALAALPHRSGSAKNPTYFPLTPRLLAGLDTLAVLDTVTYAHGGRPLD